MYPQARVLIVDPDNTLREALAASLQEKGYYVESVAEGEAAVVRLKEQPFNIALIELKLPDTEGTDLLLRLKRINPELEVIILTQYAILESAVQTLRHGAFDYVIKPPILNEVLASVGAALERQRLSLGEKQRLDREIKEKEFYRSLSIVNGLTGLYNQRHYQEVLAQELVRARRYSHPLTLLMVDIDNFKKYQDARGHLIGDEALRQIAQTLRQAVREVDIVARYGGEEFAILMAETEKEAAVVAAERVRAAIAGAEFPQGGRLTASIGVASYPADANDQQELLARADQAQYRAKQAGGNRVCLWRES